MQQTKYYTIKELENFTGINAHTIRAWEKRYSIIKPIRSDNNFRLYTLNDLKLLIKLNFLTECGYKISKLCQLSQQNIENLFKNEFTNEENMNKDLTSLLLSIIEKDDDEFEEKLLAQAQKLLPAELITNVLEPLRTRLQKLWLISKNEEQFYQNYILNKLFILTIRIAELEKKSGRKTKSILIFNSDKNQIPLRLAFVYYIALSKNYKSYFLIKTTPVEYLYELKGKIEPDIVFTEFNDNISEKKFLKYVEALEECFPTAKNIVSGFKAKNYWKLIPNKVYYVFSIDVFKKVL